MGGVGDPGSVRRPLARESEEPARRAGVASADLIESSVDPVSATVRGAPTPHTTGRPSLVFVRAGQVPYELAWSEQRRLHAARLAGEVPDTVLLLEHPSGYTAGRRTEVWERPVDGTPVIDVDRGGKITWHGPGQLVGYPILALPVPVDVVAYVRRLEA